MSRKNQAKREKRLASGLMQPEQMGFYKALVPKQKFLRFCHIQNMNRLHKLIQELPNSQYQAFWQVITFFVLKPSRSGYTEVVEDEIILSKLKEIDNTLAVPYSEYAMKKKIRQVHEANNNSIEGRGE